MRRPRSCFPLLPALAATCAILLAGLTGLTGCPDPKPNRPSVILLPCDPEVCDAPRQCRAVQGDRYCVFTCPGAVPGEEQVCGLDQFAIDPSGPASCACVGLSPTGRACEADSDCPYGPGETGPVQLCASLAGGSKTCQPVGVSCSSNNDCRSGYTCQLPDRQCVPFQAPPEPEVVYRRDADNDGRCTSESVRAKAPGPGAGWRAGCTADEQPRCDLNPLYSCAPGELEVIGSAQRIGTVHTPSVQFTTEQGVRYILSGELTSQVSAFEGGNRLQLSGRVTGPSGTGIDTFEVHWFTVLELAGGDKPLLGRLRIEGGEPYLYTESRKVHLTARTPAIIERLRALADWEIWVVGKDEGSSHRIWRHGKIYKPTN